MQSRDLIIEAWQNLYASLKYGQTYNETSRQDFEKYALLVEKGQYDVSSLIKIYCNFINSADNNGDFQRNVLDALWNYHYRTVVAPEKKLTEEEKKYYLLAKKLVAGLSIDECITLSSHPLSELSTDEKYSSNFPAIHYILSTENSDNDKKSLSQFLRRELHLRLPFPLEKLPEDFFLETVSLAEIPKETRSKIDRIRKLHLSLARLSLVSRNMHALFKPELHAAAATEIFNLYIKNYHNDRIIKARKMIEANPALLNKKIPGKDITIFQAAVYLQDGDMFQMMHEYFDSVSQIQDQLLELNLSDKTIFQHYQENPGHDFADINVDTMAYALIECSKKGKALVIAETDFGKKWKNFSEELSKDMKKAIFIPCHIISAFKKLYELPRPLDNHTKQLADYLIDNLINSLPPSYIEAYEQDKNVINKTGTNKAYSKFDSTVELLRNSGITVTIPDKNAKIRVTNNYIQKYIDYYNSDMKLKQFCKKINRYNKAYQEYESLLKGMNTSHGMKLMSILINFDKQQKMLHKLFETYGLEFRQQGLKL